MTQSTHEYDFDLEPVPDYPEFETSPPEVTDKLSKFTLAAAIGVTVVLALVGVDVAVISGSQQPRPRPIVQVVKVTGTSAIQPVVYLSVTPGIKPGTDGKLHDAYSVTDFNVHAGRPVKLVINNTDTVAHSIDSPTAGVNIIVRPGTHTYTLLVHRTGHFLWYCGLPCDPYSMAHVGYMRGYITAV
jgi:hypothetical protein